MTHPNQTIDTETITEILALTDKLLDEGKHIQTFWDLRNCQVPGIMVIGRVIRWAMSRKAKLDEFNHNMAICMPNRPALLKVVRLILKVFGPACNVVVSESEDACEELVA